MGHPEACVVAVDSKVFNIYRVSDTMSKKGWSLSPLQFPFGFVAYNEVFSILKLNKIIIILLHSIHLCVTYLHTLEGVADRFLDDMRETVAEIMKNPKDDDAGSVLLIYFFLATFYSFFFSLFI